MFFLKVEFKACDQGVLTQKGSLCENSYINIVVINPVADVGKQLFSNKLKTIPAKNPQKRAISGELVVNMKSLLGENNAVYCFFIIGIFIKLIYSINSSLT